MGQADSSITIFGKEIEIAVVAVNWLEKPIFPRVVIKTKFRHGSNDSLGIIAGPSEYVKEIGDRKIKLEKGIRHL